MGTVVVFPRALSLIESASVNLNTTSSALQGNEFQEHYYRLNMKVLESLSGYARSSRSCSNEQV